MSVLRTKNISSIKKGIKSNSCYDARIPYRQRELDEYRISEGYTKEEKEYSKRKRRIDE